MLTQSQALLLKAAINADPALSSQPQTSDGAFAIATAFNLVSIPAFIVWATNVSTAAMKRAVAWTELIARSIGERDALVFMLSDGFINGADLNIRQGIQDVFSGPGGAVSRAAIIVILKRAATRGEAALATGAGTDASPGTMTFEGNLGYRDIEQARAS